MQVFPLVVTLALAGTLVGCKAARWREKRQPEGGAQSAPAAPRLTASADAAAAPGAALFDLDERTGRPKVDLVLRLDYFPEPRPGVTNLPACYGALPPDFELGVAACEGRSDLQARILAKHVEQDCYTSPAEERVHAEVPLSLPGCKRALLATHVFEPALRVDIELRDVN